MHLAADRPGALCAMGRTADDFHEGFAVTYAEQAAAFDWKRWDAYIKLWADADGESIASIAAQFGRPPCEVRRVMLEGRRLERWRPKS